MKNDGYYAGHEFRWILQFLNATPKRYVKSISYSVASAIHHQYIYKKSNKFSLPHSIQILFGIQSRSLPKYLRVFQRVGLLKFENSAGNSFEVELLVLPNCTNKNSTKDIKVTKYTGQLDNDVQVGVHHCTGNLDNNVQVNLDNNVQVNKRRKEGSKEPLKERRNHRRKDGGMGRRK